MGQQQLLLLVLSTVIVGLATVAGIQAFQQNQGQAANDALTQKAVSIASDIQAQAAKPDQLGGIDPTSDGADAVARAIGVSTDSIKASGAGGNAGCTIVSTTNGIGAECGGGNATSQVTAEVTTSDGSGDISTSFSSN